MPLPKKPKENSHEKKIQFFIYKKKKPKMKKQLWNIYKLKPCS
jgi:hypothetical protein